MLAVIDQSTLYLILALGAGLILPRIFPGLGALINPTLDKIKPPGAPAATDTLGLIEALLQPLVARLLPLLLPKVQAHAEAVAAQAVANGGPVDKITFKQTPEGMVIDSAGVAVHVAK